MHICHWFKFKIMSLKCSSWCPLPKSKIIALKNVPHVALYQNSKWISQKCSSWCLLHWMEHLNRHSILSWISWHIWYMHNWNLHTMRTYKFYRRSQNFIFINWLKHARLIDCKKAPSHFIFTQMHHLIPRTSTLCMPNVFTCFPRLLDHFVAES